MKFLDDKRVLVTGGAGFLGKNVVNHLVSAGVEKGDIIVPRSRDLDLRIWENCVTAVSEADVVIHLAGIVGGIGYNMQYPGSAYYDNAIMGIHMIEASRRKNVDKFVGMGTICSYPKFTPLPFQEKYLWDGYPEETNAPYGLAKKMMLVQSQAYRQQYGMNAIHLLLVNLYGPGDNFDPASSHVVSALIKKFVDAKKCGSSSVEVWGTGVASREFLYVDDAARGIVLATALYNSPEPVNIGAGMEITIRELVDLISELTKFDGEIVWDTSKPDGQPRRCLDVSVAEREFGFRASTSFRDGLQRTIDWYIHDHR